MHLSWALVFLSTFVAKSESEGNTCLQNQFRCNDGWCVSLNYLCDGEEDCSDGADERNCPGKSVKTLSCTPKQFSCGDRCISQDFRCDGERDCMDGSDERNCSGTKKPKCRGYKCRDASKCISSLNRCNGNQDCDDGSDEALCFEGTRLDAVNNCYGFKCDDGQCINEEKLCDGRRDCFENEDESPAQCSHHQCAEKCDHFCRHHYNGSVCDCRPGFRLIDGQQCQPDDSCMASGCSQKCSVAKGGSVSCMCSEGYDLIAGKRCRLASQQSGPLVLYTSDSQIRQRDAFYHENTIVFNDRTPNSAVATFDMDIAANKLYAISNTHNGHETNSRVLSSIGRGQPKEVFRNSKFGILRDIALDWITKNIYLIDGDHESIIACRSADGLCVDVFTNLGFPMSFVLDPTEGRMFWVNADKSSPGIFQGWMDGTNSRLLVPGANISSLAFDQFSNRLYWVNGNTMKIEFMSLQFGTRGQLADLFIDGVVLSMSVFGDELHWSEVSRLSSSVRTCDKLTGENYTTLVKTQQENHLMVNVKVLQPLMQPQRSNPCWKSRCSHMCALAGPSKSTCLCPKYYTLTTSTQCEMKTESYLLANSNQMFRLPATIVTDNDLVAEESVMKIGGVGAIAIDVDGGVIYAVEDLGEPKIIKVNLRGEYSIKALQNVSVELVKSMTFDYLNRVLYWLDVHKKAVMIFNPSRNETTKIDVLGRMTPSLIPMDFAVDFFRGKIYVVLGSAIGREHHVLVYSVNGTLLEDMRDLSPKPTRITVDLSRGTPFIYDQKEKRILSVLGTSTNVAIEKVEPVSQLEFWKDRLTWTEQRQRGFFTAPSVGWQIQHIVRSSWTTPTRALAFTGGRLPNQKSQCLKSNGGCSHTCLSTLTETQCICPMGMVLDQDGKTCSSAAKTHCRETEFACTNGYQCIHLSNTCDGISQCDDGSDEAAAFCEKCANGFLKCATSSGCYSEAAKCDGDRDCQDGSDEFNCTMKAVSTCDDDEYKCRVTNDCIQKHRLCNGRLDCMYGDDEENCPCKTKRFCPEGKCLQERDICDGFNDCRNGEDEFNCGRCPVDMHECDNLCLAKKLLCDGIAQCSDKSDEFKCVNTTRGLVPEICARNEKTMWCDGICVREHEICDHYPDCEDASDEKDCKFEAECPPNHFKCDNSKCIPSGLLCDHEDDCGDKSDESQQHCGYLNDKRTEELSCFSDEYQCSDGSCIPASKVCDSRNDCSDGSDEGRHCSRDECSRNPCQQHCHDTPEGYRCSCDKGYTLSSDHVSCMDVDECEEYGHCSHYCHNTKGSFECFCGLGYKLLPDNRTCALEKNDPVFLFVSHNQIRAISKRHHILNVLAQGETDLITGLTFDSVYETIYWSEGQSVSKLPIGDHSIGAEPVVVAQHMWQPSHLSYDWVAKNMYFVDGKQEIEACNMNFTICAHLPTPPLKTIRSLALAASEGVMFISYFKGDSTKSNSTGGVFRINMDGSGAVEIIPQASLSPSSLQVDFIHRRLYVADPQLRIIEHFKFDGTDRRVLLRGHHMHSFALFPDQIFWSEGNAIMRADWFKAASPQLIAPDAHAYFMEVMHQVRQPVEISPCVRANCGQLCLLRPHGYTCACDALFALDTDNKTCIKQAQHKDQEGLQFNFCEPACENGGFCAVRSERGFCMCPRGYSGHHCEVVVGQRSSLLSIILAALLIFAVLGISIIGILYLRGSLTIPAKFKLSATYRATDMKKLMENENEDRSGGEELDGNLASMNLMNPLYAVDIDQTDMSSRTTKTSEKVPEGNLLDL